MQNSIKDYSWVMKIQDRGSPHIHMVLWTEKSAQELIDMNVVHTSFPPGTSSINSKKLTTVLIEFSGGIKFNNVDTKENHDVLKLSSACKKSIDYITATTDMTVPIPEHALF
ncbi:hypothetical protein INT47_000394 [Mucor saturninus]|uniref:Helitron helicase-like domain-containing protein n=1 Tax=Mucor saturninus TaxID=64648 RepID=A0A8H7QUU9_9FUNG|nr:hypothetical protein INT47_000394 [Mucor saturninus]